ncbi:MAG: hypothetical protein AAGF79_05340 [Pseudomonadota bacterium]
MKRVGTETRRAALRSVERADHERLAALVGICTFFAGIILASIWRDGALERFWVWFVILWIAFGAGYTVYDMTRKDSD